MKINFTKAEYRTLLDIAYMASWVLTAHDIGEDPDKAGYAALLQKIYSHAKEMGHESLVDHDKMNNSFQPNHTFETESSAHDWIDAYDENIFWDELIERLTARDLALAGQPLGGEDYFHASAPLLDRYNDEFTANGLNNLKLVDPE